MAIVQSCSTKRNTFITRTFHNITSRYNGYFYANESVKEGVEKYTKPHKDDFSKIIPLFIYPSPEEAKTLFPEMDKAIKKLSIVISRHTITTKKKKEIPGACRWIDDSYLLMGRAHFYKRDFFSALEAFDYVAKTYTKLPTRYLGLMWMIRTYDELGSISQAEAIIDLIAEDKDFPTNYSCEFAAIEAYHFILRENYGGAIKPLNKAIALVKNKKTRARYLFVLAQVQQKLGKTKKASSLYSEVIKINPNYDLTFNAQINRAKCFEVTSATAGASIKKELMRMLGDEKNTEYFDQIYYVLAEISEKEGNNQLMVDYLRKCTAASVSNPTQKAQAYLKLADYYFDNTKYKNAQAYYDSTVALIKPDFPNYEVINNKKKSLSELVANMNIISREDSLQALAKMDPKARDEKIEKMIAAIEAEEKRKKEEAEARLLEQQNKPVTNTQQVNNNSGVGQWYFYNPQTVNFGVTEFVRKWGDRKLEDNWRRANKEREIEALVVDTTSEKIAATDSTGKPKTDKKITDKKSKDFYLKDLPLTADAAKKSEQKVVEAYYNLGSIYREQLSDNSHAASAFEEMITRYPENKYQLSVYYQLYRLYLTLGNNEKADYYKNLLVTKYPDTEYAKIILNPDYNKEKAASLSEAEKMYVNAYDLYTQEKYIETIAICEKADKELGNNPLLSKFDLLEALAIGRTQGVDAFESALTRIIIKYPKDAIKDKAQEYLDLVKKQKEGVKQGPIKAAIDTTIKFEFNKDGEHFWVFIDEGKTNIDKIKIAISNINSEFYSLDNLNVESIMLDADRQIVTVKSFTGKDKAMTYYSLMSNDKKDTFKDLNNKYKTFIISTDNFPAFYKNKAIDAYLNFFENNYLKK